MSRRIISRHSFQFENVEEYTTMRRYLVQSANPRGGRYNVDAAIYQPNLQNVAFTAFAAISNPPPPPSCLPELLSGGGPSTTEYTVSDDGGFYDTNTFETIVAGGDPITNFCGV